MQWRSILTCWCAWLCLTAASAQPPASSRSLPAVPDRAVGIAPTIQSAVEALAQDGRAYASLFGLPIDQAIRELEAQQQSVAATDAIRQRFRDRIAGLYIAHDGGFRIVVLLTGVEPVPDEVIATPAMAVPVTYQTGAPATREQILAAIQAHQAEIRSALRSPPGMGADPRSGTMVVMVRESEIGSDGPEALAARLQAMAGVPVEVKAWDDADINLALQGGGRVFGFDATMGRRGVCTSGFVVTDGSQTALSTAAHCPDEIIYAEPGGGEVPLTMVGAWGAAYQDVQIHIGAGTLLPLIYTDAGKTVSRPITSWRNRESTRAGDVVCHRGERTGYSCAEVLYPDYAPPGDLCAGPCPPAWVAVRGPTCKGGDSGGPVFSGTIAFGLVKGSSYTADGQCRLYYYMSTDYLPPGWTVAVDQGGQRAENKKTPETN